MADTPLIYGNYSSNMFAIIPDGEKVVGHNTLGKEKINPQKIFNKFIEIINQEISFNTKSFASFTIEDNRDVSGEISG